MNKTAISIGGWDAAGNYAHIALFSLGELKTIQLSTVVSAFIENATKVCLLSRVPTQLIFFGQQYKMAEIAASIMTFGSPCYDGYTGVLSKDPQEQLKQTKALRDSMLGVLSGTIKPPFQMPGSAFYFDDVMLPCFGDMLRSGYDTLMRSQIILTWTALETLAGDLWEAAVNAHPIRLSAMKGGKKEHQRLDRDLVERNKFDLRNAMGTMLKHNFRFSSLKDIREAYKAAFHDQGVGVRNAIDNDSFSAINALRNVIVHKSGICDYDYKEIADKLPGLIPQLEIGQELQVTGMLIQRTIVPAMEMAIQLIRSVDGWIAGHPAYNLSPDCHDWSI